jgi:hypothetical protein
VYILFNPTFFVSATQASNDYSDGIILYTAC